MAKSIYQKCKLLYLMKIFYERTDENHGMTLSEITEALEGYDIVAERKTLYDDFEMLRHFGMDIVSEKKDRTYTYRLVGRNFETAELKLLVDSVQAAKFITEKKSDELIRKLESLTSMHEARHLQREVYVSGRVKTINEKILYNVDMIHEAVSNNRMVEFRYFQWNEKKEMVLRHKGKIYCISPWGMIWDDDNYYMVGYDAETGIVKHYRVDKMIDVSCTEYPREGKTVFERKNMAEYSKKMFDMFDGEETVVKMLFDNSMAGVVIDRFGKDVAFVPAEDGKHFTISVKVAVSRQFLGWIMSLGDGVTITGPESVVERMKQEANKLVKKY